MAYITLASFYFCRGPRIGSFIRAWGVWVVEAKKKAIMSLTSLMTSGFRLRETLNRFSPFLLQFLFVPSVRFGAFTCRGWHRQFSMKNTTMLMVVCITMMSLMTVMRVSLNLSHETLDGGPGNDQGTSQKTMQQATPPVAQQAGGQTARQETPEASPSLSPQFDNSVLERLSRLHSHKSALEEAHDMYGMSHSSKIIGMNDESCRNFQSKGMIPAVAGLFNTGTNLLYKLLHKNCKLPTDVGGIPWQVMWGKHNPVDFRGRHFASEKNRREGTDFETELPVVIVKVGAVLLRGTCKRDNGLRQVAQIVFVSTRRERLGG